ncbi:MAG TPA: glycoside hydrolase family 3 C-terminal domain-containing protein [Bacteroidales bacterium]|nr:glycoside hydrolase family 3 C-terminal domain-containing protein [Bacteroidales bacterium]
MVRRFRTSSTILLITLIITNIVSGQSYDKDSKQLTSSFKWPEGKKMALSLTFDDARLSQIDKGIPLLDRYGVKATFYVSPNNLVQRLEGWKKAVHSGHDIGNHSLVHPCTGNFPWSRSKALEDYSLLSMMGELDSASTLIKQLLGTEPASFAYPCGQKFTGTGVNTKSYIPVVASMFESGRGWLDEAANDPSYCDMAQLTGMELDGKSFDQILKLIETAGNSGMWLVLAGHEMDKEGVQTSQLETLEAICRYASDPSNGIWIADVHTIAAYVKEQRGEKPHSQLPVYKNPVYPVNMRVADLLGKMTLEEKIGQMNMPCVYEGPLGRTTEEKTEAVKKLAEGTFDGMPGPIGGFFTLANTILHQGTLQQANFFNDLQKRAIEKTRLGVPLLQTEEGTHGLMCSGGTIFPEGLALGSMWNIDLVNDIYTVAAREARAVGIHQIFTLVVEPNRDPRLGRNQEGYGEDPYFCARMAETIVHAVQGTDLTARDKTVAGLCHYPGQSQPASGLERGAMEISERTLREVFLPPWEAGIKKAGALGVMATYPAIDRIPTHGNEFILTKILREEFGFKGLVLSEGGGLSTLSYMGLARNEKETGELALKAGLDVGISYENGYILPMLENVKEGKVSMELIDRSVTRILEQKFRLGLFENPYTDPARAVKVTHTEESRNLTLEAAREGIVLLKNEKNILPLKKNIRSIAVIGPNADNEKNQLGDYTSRTVLQEIVTVLDGIKSKAGANTTVRYTKGCDVIGEKNKDIAGAKKTAKECDVAIVVLGENEWQSEEKTGTDGEGYDVASLDLTGYQEELLKAVYETGTPTILVLINGRPLSVRWAAEKIPAIVEAWIPGEMGGLAVADILFGECNPSGKLTITVPRHSGQLPSYYNYMPEKEHWITEGWGNAYADMPATPLWEFGYGLSYTSFEYSNLQITPASTGSYGDISVNIDIKNTGSREGKEVVQLYIRDLYASVTVPVKELKGFSKIALKPGEKKTVIFKLTHDDLALYDRNMNKVVEAGTFEVMAGSSSMDIRAKGTFEVK